jgi:hypothetical protein
MDITRLTGTSVKIKTKTASLVIDPNAKAEAEVILTVVHGEVDESVVTNNRIVIDGPGEYEIMDVAIQCVRYGDFLGYRIDDGAARLLIAPSTVIDKVKDEEAISALLIKAVEAFDIEKVTSFSPGVCIVFGDPMLLDHATDAKKSQKVNIRKIDETLAGQVVVLQKE